MPDPIPATHPRTNTTHLRVTPEELRAHADCVGEIPYHREMVLRAADRIEALEARNRELEEALERIAASGWPSDLRQDPPQAIAREALDA